MQKEVREGSSVSSRNSDESSQNSSYAEDDPQKGTLGQTEPRTRRKKKNPLQTFIKKIYEFKTSKKRPQ